MFFKCIFLFLFAYLCFVFLLGCVLVLLVLFVLAKSFCKKEFKTASITSFILLLNLSYYKHEFFNHYNLFQSLQSFSIITIFFNYHNLFQSLQSFLIIAIVLIITIFFNYHNLLYQNLFYHNLF